MTNVSTLSEAASSPMSSKAWLSLRACTPKAITIAGVDIDRHCSWSVHWLCIGKRVAPSKGEMEFNVKSAKERKRK